MKKIALIALTAALAVSACEEPTPVDHTPPTLEQVQERCEKEASVDPRGDADVAFKDCMAIAGFPVE